METSPTLELSTTVRRGYVDSGSILAVAAALMLLGTVAAHFSVGWLFTITAGASAWRARKRVRHVVASREGLRIDKDWIDRTRLRNAFIYHQRKTAFVRFETGRSRLDVVVPSPRLAKQLVAVLGLDGTSSVTETSLVRQIEPSISPALGILLGPTIYFGGWYLRDHVMLFFYGLLALLLCGLALFSFLYTVKVTIGADGVALRGRRRSTFLPYIAITAIRQERAIIVIEHTGAERPLRLGTAIGRPLPEHVERAAAIVRRLERARAGARSAAAPLAALDRARRSPSEWLVALRHLGRAGSYRSQHVARDLLWSVLEDAAARAIDRIAAGIALRETASAEDRERLRVAAERCANPVVRDGLRTLVRAEDDASLLAVLTAGASHETAET